MNKQTKALKLALESLEKSIDNFPANVQHKKSITAIKEALAQPEPLPEQEPVAESFMVSLYNRGYKDGHHDTVKGQYIDILRQDMGTYHSDVVSEWIDENLNTAVYTTPAKRPWAGLTDDDMPSKELDAFCRGARWADGKLKEKNA